MTFNKFSLSFLRFHGYIAISIGILLSVMALKGYFTNSGILYMLHLNSLGFIGMIQSYSFMIILGVLLCIGSYQERRAVWHLLGILAHIVPFLGNIIFWELADKENLGHQALILHTSFILIEFYCLVRIKKNK